MFVDADLCHFTRPHRRDIRFDNRVRDLLKLLLEFCTSKWFIRGIYFYTSVRFSRTQPDVKLLMTDSFKHVNDEFQHISRCSTVSIDANETLLHRSFDFDTVFPGYFLKDILIYNLLSHSNLRYRSRVVLTMI